LEPIGCINGGIGNRDADLMWTYCRYWCYGQVPRQTACMHLRGVLLQPADFLTLKTPPNVYPCVAKNPPVPKNLTGTSTLNMPKNPRISTSLKLLRNSYYPVTFEHSRSFLQENRLRVVVLAPDLSSITIDREIESRRHAATIKSRSPLKLIKGSCLSFRAFPFRQ